LAIAGVSTSAWLAVRATRPEQPVIPVEFELQLPDSLATWQEEVDARTRFSQGSNASFALSRDGSVLVFQAARPGEPPALWVRRLDDRTVQRLRGADSAFGPVFSPDGRELSFWSWRSAGIQRVSLRGGAARTIADVAASQWSWGDTHQIIYVSESRLWTVSEDGGPPTLLAVPDSTRKHRIYGWPEILPGGRAALITIWKGGRTLDNVVLGAVTIPGGKVTELSIRGTNPRYSATGHILYATRDGSLFAVPFSSRSLRPTGPSVPVVEGVRLGPGGGAAFSIAQNGTLAWLSGGLAEVQRTLVAVSRAGVARSLAAKAGFYSTPRVSPDGRRVALGIGAGGGTDIWLFDLQSSVLTRVTKDAESMRPAWSTDGERIAYVKVGGDSVVMWRPLYASGQATPLVRSTLAIWEIAMGRPHGYAAVRIDNGVNGSSDIWIAPMDSVGPPRPLLNCPYSEWFPRISPEGRLIAYVTNKTARSEVYMRPLLGDGPQVQVSVGGGTEPVWAPDGRELFYRAPGYMMSARIAEQPRLDVVRRDTLFRDPFVRLGTGSVNYDVFPDGKALLMVAPGAGPTREKAVLTVIINWKPGQRAVTSEREP